MYIQPLWSRFDRSCRQAAWLLVVALAAAYSVVARAQVTTGDTGETIALPPVEVSAQPEAGRGPVVGYAATRSAAGTKTDTPLIETPQAISVVTRDQMNIQNAQTINQAISYSSGIRAAAGGGGADVRFDGNVTIRGFLADQYLDELKLFRGSFTGAAVDPWLLERIEVVHGPGSVLYGQASPGGFLNLVSKLPVPEPLHVTQLQTGSFGRIQGAFDLGGPLDPSGTLLYRIAGLGRHTGTQVDFTTYERLALAPSLAWKPTGDTTVTFLGSMLYDPQGGFFNQLPLQGSVRFNPNGQIPTTFYQGDPNFDRFRRSQETIGYIVEHRLGDAAKLRQNVRYLHQDVNYRGVYGVGFRPDLSTLNRNAFLTTEDQNAVGLDNQVLGKATTGPVQHDILFGLGYQYAQYIQSYREGSTTTINYLNPVYFPTAALPANPAFRSGTRQTQDQVGIYLQDQARLDRLMLTIGGRQDWLGTATTNRVTNTTARTDDAAFSWRAAVLYAFDGGVSPYYSYTTSFQPTAGVGFGGAPFQPTKGRQHEIGVKYQTPDSRALVTMALFDMVQSNVLTPDPAHTNFSVQTGEVRSRGVELEAKARLTDGLSLIAAYTYLDPVVTKSNGTNAGKNLNGIPPQTAAVWADYAFQAPGWAGLAVGAGVRYASAAPGNTTNTFDMPEAVLVDAMIRYDLGAQSPQFRGVQLQLNATNLFDEQYISHSQNNGAYYGLRRTILANLNYRW